MPNTQRTDYRRCFIAAPFGSELGVLPELLAERNISWQWAAEGVVEPQAPRAAIEAADFMLVVLNGTRADHSSTFAAGIAVGLNKPILLIQTRPLMLPLEYSRFTVVKAKLSNRDALGFHLDLFLAAPPQALPPVDSDRPHETVSYVSTTRRPQRVFEADIERRVYEAVIAAGGSAITQPTLDSQGKFRPDMLAWLGHLEAEWLDPVVIEVKHSADHKSAAHLDEKLMQFLQTARLKMALVLTGKPVPQEIGVFPNVLWLTIDDFERLIRTQQLGPYVKATRNRLVHGVR